MLNLEQAKRLADDVVDFRIPGRHATSYNTAARELAIFVRGLPDETPTSPHTPVSKDAQAMLENLTVVQTRCNELLEDRRTLCRLVGQLEKESPDERSLLIERLGALTTQLQKASPDERDELIAQLVGLTVQLQGATTNGRDGVIAELVTAARAMQ